MIHQEQDMPVRNDEDCIQDLVIQDIEKRKTVGVERYGTTLQAFNQRNAVRDAYEEALDLCQYMKQMDIERKALIETLHRIMDAPSVTAAHTEAYVMLLRMGEIEYERC